MSDVAYIAKELEKHNSSKQEPVNGKVIAIEGDVAVLATKQGVKRKFFKTVININDDVIIDGDFCQKIQKRDQENVVWV